MTQPVVTVIQTVQEVRQPRHVVLGRDDFQLGMALEHAAEHHVGQGQLNFLGQAHIAVQDIAEVNPVALAGGQDMQRQRHVHIRGCGPERIVVRMAIRAVFRGRTPDQGAAQTLFSDPLQFGDTGRNVFQGHRAEADQPIRVVAGILGCPVVEGAEGRGAQLSVFEPKQQHAH